jgi:hypothetical protein
MMAGEYGSLDLVLRTLRCRLFGVSDAERWRDLRNHERDWEERTRLIAGLVPKGSCVIEFGAGRRVLESYLERTCTYIPADLVRRSPETVVCDLNVRPLPDLCHLKPGVAVFAGVLEYTLDLSAICHWLSRWASLCIASYECASSRPRTLGRIKETIFRTRAGWINTYTEEEFESLFGRASFLCVQKLIWTTKDGSERIFVFSNESLRHES